MEWLLILVLLTPKGEFVSKVPVPYSTKAACEQALVELKKPQTLEGPQQLRSQGVACVSRGHYTGKTVDKGVPLD